MQLLDLITDPNKEILHYLQVIYLRKNHYNETFQIPQPVIENDETIKKEINMNNEMDTNIITLSQVKMKHMLNMNILHKLISKLKNKNST